MTYSIIGSGNVGASLATQFARSGITVKIANTRGPESIAAMAEELGSEIVPATLHDALKADVVILAVPFRAHTAVAHALTNWSGKVVVDAMNTYGVSPEELEGRASTDVVASAFPGAKLVKTLNQLPAKLLAKDPAESGGRRVMFVSSNDQAAEASIAKLVGELGFSPVSLGRVNEGGALIGMGGPLILQNFIKQG
ncbi:NADPH-dependent F420 reductase [Variovorax sp. J22P271]|uniref:NADPH-dependent F420 reductase n=1 Tax=Variovorax davisae TaxID=3053515 RepID=UPI0025770EC5|nr:NADPH-dependent F420 reductase [Variovorax sp. J22P271]MDM0032474.1 NADPH-dependent F420 reductase [Variovorax sp. J22P271]